MNETNADRHINPEISPELFDEEKRDRLTVENLKNSEAVWAMILFAIIFGVIKIDDIKEITEKEEI